MNNSNQHSVAEGLQLLSAKEEYVRFRLENAFESYNEAIVDLLGQAGDLMNLTLRIFALSKRDIHMSFATVKEISSVAFDHKRLLVQAGKTSERIRSSVTVLAANMDHYGIDAQLWYPFISAILPELDQLDDRVTAVKKQMTKLDEILGTRIRMSSAAAA